MSPISEPIQKHVPAWKKLGLKLKFAKEEPEYTQFHESSTANQQKRKVPAEEEEEAVVGNTTVEWSAKKVKKLKSRADESGEAVNGNGTSHGDHDEVNVRSNLKDSEPSNLEFAKTVNGNRNTNEPTNVERPSKRAKKSKVRVDASTNPIKSEFVGTNEDTTPSSPPALKTTPASKGKSVSFTPDTKTSDGDSVKGLYKTWIAKQIATDPLFDPSTVSPALRSIIPSSLASIESPSPIISTSPPNTSKDKKKPTKKRKIRLPKTSDSGPSRFDAVLTYLTTHHTSPETWKFSKSHQNQILKHLFSLKHIPSSYNAALLSYIRGLNGTSARSRIRREALSVREEDEKWLASEPSESEKMENETVAQCNARRRRDYEAAVARIKQTLEEIEDKREEYESEVLGENKEWEERCQRRRRAEIVLWGVGEEDEDEMAGSGSLSGQYSRKASGGHQKESGLAQLARAAQKLQPAPRVGRGVGMGMGGVEVIDAGGIARDSKARKVVFTDDEPAQAGGTNSANGANVTHGVRIPNTGSNGTTNSIKPKRKRKKRTGVPDDDDDSSSSSSSSSSEGEQDQRPQQRKVVQRRAETSGSDSSSGTASSSGESDTGSD